MKAITINTKDVGDVKDCFRRECECVKTLEDRNEDYIIKEMGI